MKKIIILGSTGSIGTQTLEIVRAHPERFEVLGLCAHSNSELFEAQVKEFRPKYVLQTSLSENPSQALAALAQSPECDLVVNALAGYAGFAPTYAALQAGKQLALANKESLVMAGELLIHLAKKTGAEIIPIDSELSGLHQLLASHPAKYALSRIVLTASGGPFWRYTREQLVGVSAAQALKHPTWKMGEKVSIDSATLMNKAFEIIEAHWLFNIAPEKIEATIHRQSIIHALTEFSDGTFTASLSQPDMKIPIHYALFYPHRVENALPRVDFNALQLTFEKPDYSIFEGPQLAYEALKAGGVMPAVLCLADEIAVQKFLAGEISFLNIYDFIKRSLDKVKNMPLSLESMHEVQRIIRTV